MLKDLTEKIQSSQSKFEELTSRIPGYAGYKRKEQRREADKLLRLHVARQYEEQLQRLNEAEEMLISEGGLKIVLTLERAVMKLQLLIDRIKTASYGYAGLMDAIKVDEEALDKLYAFDQAMLEGVEQISGLLDQLLEAAQGEGDTSAAAGALVVALAGLNTTFSCRQDVILD
jgi:hypothetical protein